MAIDVDRFRMITPQLQQYWSSPMQASFCCSSKWVIYIYLWNDIFLKFRQLFRKCNCKLWFKVVICMVLLWQTVGIAVFAGFLVMVSVVRFLRLRLWMPHWFVDALFTVSDLFDPFQHLYVSNLEKMDCATDAFEGWTYTNDEWGSFWDKGEILLLCTVFWDFKSYVFFLFNSTFLTVYIPEFYFQWEITQ